jgi:FkbM family methyltransferase
VLIAPYTRADAKLNWARRRTGGDPALAVVDTLAGYGEVVVDVGADWGVYATRLSDLVGPTGRVHAFEPHPLSRERLEAVTRSEPQVRVHGEALSDHEGTATLHVPVEDGEPVEALAGLSPRRGVQSQQVTVRTTTLDAALGEDAERVSFVKIDVEGHELAVLRGAERVLASARPRLLVEIEHRHAGDLMDATFEHMASLGYSASAVTPRGLVPIGEFDVEADQLAYLGHDFRDGTPREYVNDFVFVPEGRSQTTPSSPSARAVAARDADQE